MREIVDLFAGGGGASEGIEQATGQRVDVAINHSLAAIRMHEVNHPHARHFCADIFEVDPLLATKGRPVWIIWGSPACTHFSVARGGKPVDNQQRSLAWVLVEWAKAVRPQFIFCENVAEFANWGPLDADQLPRKDKLGETFREWVGALQKLGYRVDWRVLRASDFGAPTIRSRLFVVARRDGQAIEWPAVSHGDPTAPGFAGSGLLPWKTAADCIDWSIPCPSIFERKKPLADATLARITRGILRYVINAPAPFIAPGIITATQPDKRVQVAAFLAKHYRGATGSNMAAPISTITAIDHHSLVTSNLIKMRGDNTGSPSTEPLHTISAQGTHHAEVRALLIKYYGTDQNPRLDMPMHTIPTKDRFAVVMVNGEPHQIADIGMRMLSPRELFNAQGFASTYRIDEGINGKPFTNKERVRMVGNSVCPQVAKALVLANITSIEGRMAA